MRKTKETNVPKARCQDGEVAANTRCPPPLLHLDSPEELQLSLGGGRLRPCGKIPGIERLVPFFVEREIKSSANLDRLH